MGSAWEGRVGLGQVGRTLFPTQLPFHDSKSVPEKRPPPTTSSPTHLHDPSREPHPHASLSLRIILLLAGRDGAGSGASPHHVRSGAWQRASTDSGPTRLLPPFQPSVRGPASRPHCFSQPSNQITYTHLTSCLSREGRRAGLGPWGTSLDRACL